MAFGGLRKWSANTSRSFVRGYDACEKVETWRFDLTVPVPHALLCEAASGRAEKWGVGAGREEGILLLGNKAEHEHRACRIDRRYSLSRCQVKIFDFY